VKGHDVVHRVTAHGRWDLGAEQRSRHRVAHVELGVELAS
jgi:hypothetical protein